MSVKEINAVAVGAPKQTDDGKDIVYVAVPQTTAQREDMHLGVRMRALELAHSGARYSTAEKDDAARRADEIIAVAEKYVDFIEKGLRS